MSELTRLEQILLRDGKIENFSAIHSRPPPLQRPRLAPNGPILSALGLPSENEGRHALGGGVCPQLFLPV
jgi:hypothetical protein